MTSNEQPSPTMIEAPAPVGRSMLFWSGKETPRAFSVPPVTFREAFSPGVRILPSGEQVQPNCLLHGDNLAGLAYLLANGFRGRVQLIYIDPPFDSGADYARRLQLRGENEQTGIPGGQLLGRQIQYSDTWAEDSYLQFMYERLLLMRELLAPNGTLWLHCDHRKSAHLQLVLEEVFGAENYLNTISWRSQVARGAKVRAFYFPRSTHYIHIFARDRAAPPIWNRPHKEILLTRAEAALRYMEDERGFFRTSHPGTYSFERLVELHQQGRIYAPYGGDVIIDEANRRVYGSNGGNIGVKYYLERRGRDRFVVRRAVDNLWDDIPGLGTVPSEDENYPTQKTEALLRRILETGTNPGDLVLDCFVGSGTTVAVAQKLGRSWIGCDVNPVAIQTTSRRMQRLLQEQAGETPPDGLAGGTGSGDDVDPDGERPTAPAFVIYTVGDPNVESSVQAKPTISADVHVSRKNGTIRVDIRDFHNPEVLQHPGMRQALAAPPEWQSTVVSVAIDPAFDGRRFCATLADAPKGKGALVKGVYELAASSQSGMVAVKIVDMLGHEFLSVQKI